MINITCATREDMESSLEQMIVRCVAAYKKRVLQAVKAEGDLMLDSFVIEHILNEIELELLKSLKVEVSGANQTLNDLIDGSISH
jgi:hypothetical protein